MLYLYFYIFICAEIVSAAAVQFCSRQDCTQRLHALRHSGGLRPFKIAPGDFVEHGRSLIKSLQFSEIKKPSPNSRARPFFISENCARYSYEGLFEIRFPAPHRFAAACGRSILLQAKLYSALPCFSPCGQPAGCSKSLPAILSNWGFLPSHLKCQ